MIKSRSANGSATVTFTLDPAVGAGQAAQFKPGDAIVKNGTTTPVVHILTINYTANILTMDNVIVTAHAAGYSDDVPERMVRTAVAEITNVLKGGTPRPAALLNPDVLNLVRI